MPFCSACTKTGRPCWCITYVKVRGNFCCEDENHIRQIVDKCYKFEEWLDQQTNFGIIYNKLNNLNNPKLSDDKEQEYAKEIAKAKHSHKMVKQYINNSK